MTAGQWRAINLTHRKQQRMKKTTFNMAPCLLATSTCSTQALLAGHGSVPGAGTFRSMGTSLILIFKISTSNQLQKGLFIFSCWGVTHGTWKALNASHIGSEGLPVAMVWEKRKVLERHKARRNTVITPERYNCEIKLNCKSFERENSFALCSYI